MSADDEVLTGWSIGLSADVDLPEWVHLPRGMSAAEHELWVTEVAGTLVARIRAADPEAGPALEADVRDLLEAGLASRVESQSQAAVSYQVWPLAGPAAVLCHVSFVRSVDLPERSVLEAHGRVVPVEARHIGPGIQISTTRVVEDQGERFEVDATHLMFAGATYGIVVNLEEAPSSLAGAALIGLGALKDALVVTRPDGSRLTSTPSDAAEAADGAAGAVPGVRPGRGRRWGRRRS